MSKIILLGGMLAATLLSAGAATLAFEITKLTAHQQHLRGEIALP
jgi:hypothetical protein